MGGVPWAPGRSGSPLGGAREKQSELEQTGDRPPLLPRFSVVCHSTDPGPLTELPGQGDPTLEALLLESGP